MDLFSERELIASMEEAAKERLRKNGLSHVRVKVLGNVTSPKIELEASNEMDKEKAMKVLTELR